MDLFRALSQMAEAEKKATELKGLQQQMTFLSASSCVQVTVEDSKRHIVKNLKALGVGVSEAERKNFHLRLATLAYLRSGNFASAVEACVKGGENPSQAVPQVDVDVVRATFAEHGFTTDVVTAAETSVEEGMPRVPRVRVSITNCREWVAENVSKADE